jgi:ligand-binding sensor domain-containing protein/signal transduction histidine kinase
MLPNSLARRPLALPFVLPLVVSMCAFGARVQAELLPARTYTTSDGLAGIVVMGLTVDSRGLLWIATRDGLSRFDGARFTSYDVNDGLSSAMINGILQTRSGDYWVETNSGACRFNPRGQRPVNGLGSPRQNRSVIEARAQDGRDPLFACFQVGTSSLTNRVNVFHEDRSGRLWAGTDGGLFRLEPVEGGQAFRPVPLPLVPSDHSAGAVHTALEDADGSLWFGADWGLTRVLPDGRAVSYRIDQPEGRGAVTALALDETKRLWAGHAGGVIVLDPEDAASFAGSESPIERWLVAPGRVSSFARSLAQARVVGWHTPTYGVASGGVNALLRSPDKAMWIGAMTGLTRFDGRAFRTYTSANGVANNRVNAMVADGAGNLWIGTQTGLTRLTRSGLVTYGSADGLTTGQVHALAEDESGHLVAVIGDHRLNRFDGTRFTSIRPPLPAHASGPWNGGFGYLARTGEWWMLTTAGLYRFAKTARFETLAAQRPDAIYSSQHALPDDSIARAYEDAAGDLWVATTPGGIARFRPSTDTWHVYSERDGLPPLRQALNRAAAFAQDGASIWIGFYEGGIARFRDGRFQFYTTADGVPAGAINALHIDRAGRLWIGSAVAGVGRVDDPAAIQARFAPVMTLSSVANNVRCLSEDAWGRVYAGTSRGIYQIDPASGAVKRFTASEGLASDFVTAALRDRHGAIWFGTFNGLSRLDPSLEPPAAAGHVPQVLISGVRIRGIAMGLSELGDTDLPPVTLGSSQNQIEIDFFGLNFEPGAALRYEYRLEGASEDWTSAGELRTASYARLAPGSYRFSVRARRADGLVSTNPATFAFIILQPLYARWWFVSLAAIVAMAIGVAIYRMRVSQLLRVERVRARIATDLHDDIGASLSQIAILSEVTQQRLRNLRGDHAIGEPLTRIAETSRELVDSMDDIVWAIDPERDSVSDLVQHIRRFALDTLGGRDITVVFDMPLPAHEVRLGAAVRREVFLIVKESITNIARHAASTTVRVTFACDRRRLHLRIEDDGRGFDPSATGDGDGLRNMHRRVTALGGRLDIASLPARGTVVSLDLSLRGTS